MVYTAVGVAAGLLGEGLSAALQNPWVLGAFAVLMVALALSMFGLYELQLPQRWQTRLTASSNRRRGGGRRCRRDGRDLGADRRPCVTAPLAGALAYIAQTGDAFTGGGALFAMALGMGVPLVPVGVGAGNLLPRAGRWMEVTKRFFGFLLLGVAIWMVSPVLPAAADGGLGRPAAGGGGLSRRFRPARQRAARTGAAGQGLGLLAARPVPSCWWAWPRAAAIRCSPCRTGCGARCGAAVPGGAGHAEVRFERVASVTELETRVAQASAAGKPVLLDFYADWCVSCKEMERLTFSDTAVRSRLSGSVLLQADVTRNNADDKALLKRFGLFGPPGIILFGADGSERPVRVIGYQSAERFLDSLQRALGSATRT